MNCVRRSLGLGLLIGAQGKARDLGGRVVLIKPLENVKEVFTLMGLDAPFEFRNSVEEAVALLTGGNALVEFPRRRFQAASVLGGGRMLADTETT